MARALVREHNQNLKNFLINGDMRFMQRGSQSVGTGSTNTYCLDRFVFTKNTGTSTHQMNQSGLVPSSAEVATATGQPYTYVNSLLLSNTVAEAAIAAGEYAAIGQYIEGYKIRDLLGKPLTLSFWVRAYLTPGTYCIALSNSAYTSSYVAEYTINAINTWEYKTITIPAIVTGTWLTDNSAGLRVFWTLACGSTFQTTAGTWNAGNYLGTSNQVNALLSTSDAFRITGTMLSVGSSPAPFRLAADTHEQELALCQRYYEKSYAIDVSPGTATNTDMVESSANSGGHQRDTVVFKVNKRSALGITFYSTQNANQPGKIYNASTGLDVTASSLTNGTARATIFTAGITAANDLRYHWVVDAEIT